MDNLFAAMAEVVSLFIDADVIEIVPAAITTSARMRNDGTLRSGFEAGDDEDSAEFFFSEFFNQFLFFFAFWCIENLCFTRGMNLVFLTERFNQGIDLGTKGE